MGVELDKWLIENGFEKYKEVFFENDVDLDVIDTLTDDDLREMSVSLGDRKRFFQAVKSLDTTPINRSLDNNDSVFNSKEKEASFELPDDLNSRLEFFRDENGIIDLDELARQYSIFPQLQDNFVSSAIEINAQTFKALEVIHTAILAENDTGFVLEKLTQLTSNDSELTQLSVTNGRAIKSAIEGVASETQGKMQVDESGFNKFVCFFERFKGTPFEQFYLIDPETRKLNRSVFAFEVENNGSSYNKCLESFRESLRLDKMLGICSGNTIENLKSLDNLSIIKYAKARGLQLNETSSKKELVEKTISHLLDHLENKQRDNSNNLPQPKIKEKHQSQITATKALVELEKHKNPKQREKASETNETKNATQITDAIRKVSKEKSRHDIALKASSKSVASEKFDLTDEQKRSFSAASKKTSLSGAAGIFFMVLLFIVVIALFKTLFPGVGSALH